MLARLQRSSWFVAAAASFFGCALTVDYGDYEHASGIDQDAGSGASSGVSGGGGFGSGTAATGGASGAGTTGGGTGGNGGTSVDGGAGGIGGGTGGVTGGGTGGAGGGTGGAGCVEGTTCAPPTCSNSVYITHVCQGAECEAKQETCDPYLCSSTGCNKTCDDPNDCVPGNKCNLGKCSDCITCEDKYQLPSQQTAFCLADSQSLWNQLVGCCQANCNSVCDDDFGSTFIVCGGTSIDVVSIGCLSCLQTQGCGTDLQSCQADVVD